MPSTPSTPTAPVAVRTYRPQPADRRWPHWPAQLIAAGSAAIGRRALQGAVWPAWALALLLALSAIGLLRGVAALSGRGAVHAALAAPAWFGELMALPGSVAGDIHLLWLSSVALLLLALCQAASATQSARRRRHRLASAVARTLAQARALGSPTGPKSDAAIEDPLPVPELEPLAQGIRSLREHLQGLFDIHARQLETLRRQAHDDTVTGLPNQRHFSAMLAGLLSGESAPVRVGMVLLRLHDLQGLNQRLGRDAADRVLRTIASTLHNYPQRVPRCIVGRLSGSDFALLLPIGGIAEDTAQSLLQALQLALGPGGSGAEVASGAVELKPPLAVARALALANAAVCPRAAVPAPAQPDDGRAGDRLRQRSPGARRSAAAFGAGGPSGAADSAWQRRLSRALAQGRVRLGETPVRTADGRQSHLHGLLRVQLMAGGAFEPASRWLSLATGSEVSIALDDKAVLLALAAIAADGIARSIPIGAASAASATFVDAVSRRLEAAPESACRLSIDLPETLALEQPQTVQDLSRRWRPLGLMLGLEHAGEHLLRMPRLTDMGLDRVRIDARFVNGIAADRSQRSRRYLEGLVRLAQSVGLSVAAEGVASPRDLEQLWAIGFDAAAGPALLAGSAPARAGSGDVAEMRRVFADPPAGEEVLQRVANGAKGDRVPGNLVLLEQPRLDRLGSRVE